VPFIIPIQAYDDSPGALAVCIGGTELTGSLSVANNLRATAAGSTQIAASLTLAGTLQAASEGSTQVSASLRLNDEPNVFPQATVEGSTVLTGGLSLGSDFAALSTGGTEAEATLSVAVAEEFGFTIFLDIVGEGVQGGTVARYSARLTADGTEVPISSFDLSAPEGALGVGLAVTLAKPDVSLVTNASAVQFDLGVWTGSAFEWVTMLSGGKLAGHELTIAVTRGGPGDSVKLALLDTVGDRWTLAPERPETLYDPDQGDQPAPSDIVTVNERGAKIEPVFTPVYSMTMREVLRRAYVVGCGFDRVVTNIPDFPVSEVTFSREGGYHEAARPLLSLFEPVYFAEGNDLWIIDAGAALPAGLQPRELPLSAYVKVTDTAPARQPVSSLVVAYRSDSSAGGDYFTERLEQDDPQETGTFGVAGYTSTETERRVREYRNFDAPETIVREERVSETVTTTDYQFNVIGRETQVDSFDSLGRKSGHKRTVESRVPELAADGAFTLQKVEEETYAISYRAGAAGRDELASTVKELAGLVLIDEDRTYLGKPYEIPLDDAHFSGYLDPDAGQSVEFKAIRTVIETYRREGAATKVRRRPINHLNNASVPEKPISETRAGSTAVSRRSQGVVRRMLTLPGATAGRVVPTFGTGDLPGDMAISLGWRHLASLNSPPRQLSAQLPLLAFDIRRGTAVRPHSRSGVLGTYIVTATRVSGQSLGTQKQLITMSASGKELKA
jgi:hypothetical protein